MTDPTIFALASGRPPAAIAVIRISGPETRAALEALGAEQSTNAARQLVRVSLRDKTGDTLDDALAVWFPGPESFTGDDAAELHVHGGRAVIEGVLAALGAVPGLRMAKPGEFSRRAFENGKLDLARVEALADLIAAETEAQRRQAMRQLGGVLGAACEDWRRRLIGALALMEATIDFSDEDLPDTLDAGARGAIECVRQEILSALGDSGVGERLRDGLVVAIVGSPNAGKSTLLNALAGRDAAIVSEVAGTTRDIIKVDVEINGFPLSLIDTAGLRESADPIEREGVRRARAAAGDADLRVVVIDGATGSEVDQETRAQLERPGAIGVASKSDLGSASPDSETWDDAVIALSAKTGDGMGALERRLGAAAAEALGGSEAALITRARHREALTEASAALDRALTASGAEFWAEDLRVALAAFGRVVGRTDVDDVLDVIFREFCIGK